MVYLSLRFSAFLRFSFSKVLSVKKELEKEDIKLLDIIDLNFLQEFQDVFAKSVNVASIMVDNEGPITKPSNFTNFCMKHTRGSALGYKRCNNCDIQWGTLAAKEGKPVIYNCHSGLTDFAVPIMLNGKHIASILGGQVLTHEPDEEHFRAIARELNIDEEEYIKELRKIKVIPFEQVEKAAELLFVVANSISEMAEQNIKLMRKNQEARNTAKKETILRRIIEVTRSSLDIIEVKQNIVNVLGKAFKADRCYFRSYNRVQDKFLPPDVEYLASSNVKSLLDVEPNQEGLKFFSEELRKRSKGFYPVVANEALMKNTPLEAYMKDAEIKADYAMPIIDMEEGFAWLVLHYSKEDPCFNDDYKKLLETIAFQIDTALSQLKLYNTVQKTAERESLLRKINETIRDTLSIDETLSLICEELARLINVQRIVVTQFVNPAVCSDTIIRKEYKTKPEIKSLDIINSDKDTAKYIENFLLTGDTLCIDNIEKSDTPEYFKKSCKNVGANSMLGFAIKKGQEFWGMLLLYDYEKQRNWENEEINFLKTISNQIYISIKHTELYLTNQKQAEREIAIRKILENMRSSLDINKTLSYICDELARLYKVQRATIIEYPDRKNWSKVIVRREYKSSDIIKGALNNATFNWNIGQALDDALKANNDQECLILDNIQESNMPEFFKKNYEAMGQKSMLVMPIKKNNVIWGLIALSEYNHYRHWTEDEVNMLRTISNQIYLALTQSELYLAVQKNANTERVLRKMISSSVNNFDLKEIINSIVTETGQLFNADRCLFIEYTGQNNSTSLKSHFEYLASKEIVSAADNAPEKIVIDAIISSLKKREILISENVNDDNLMQETKNNLVDKLSVKSFLTVPIYYGEDDYGAIALHFVKNYKQFKTEEIDLLNAIASQSAAVIHQAKLYEKQEQIAEKEHVLRNITNNIRASLNIEEVKKALVTEIGKYFNADRCFIYEYGQGKKIGIYSEYTSSPDIKKMSEADFSTPQFKYWEDTMFNTNEKTGTFCPDLEQFIIDSNLQGSYVDLHRVEYNIKTAIGIPIFYAEQLFGELIIQYTKEVTQVAEEDIEFLIILAEQASLALYHAELFATIEKNERYTRTILNSINDAIITIDDNFMIEKCNPSIETIWGYSVQECLNQPLSLLLNYDCTKESDENCLMEKTIHGIRKNSETFPVEINLSKITTENKESILLVVRDITERKRMDQMKNEFVSTVSHELRTPLTSLRGSLGLITSGKMGELSDKMKNLLDIANNNCMRLINIINDILDIEKIEAGKMDFEIKAQELMPLINQAIELNYQFAQKFNVKINLVNTLDNAFVKVDANRLTQVITNLLSNAIKFSESDSYVDVLASRTNKNIQVCVTNYGAEISENFKTRIFQKFAQADSSDSRQKGGTGLGLSISKAIIEKMNGTIDFISENNKTTFYFNLPEVLDITTEV